MLISHLRKSVIHVCNLYCMLCIRFDGKKLKISNLLALKNFALLPFIILMRFFLVDVGNEAVSEEMQNRIPGEVSMSNFFVITVSSMMIANIIAMITIVIIQWKNRSINLILIQKCVTFYQKFGLAESDDFIKAERNFFKSFLAFAILMFALYLFEFVTVMRPNWEGLVFFLFYNNNGFNILFLFFFLNCFLSYFVLLLKHLKIELRKCSHSSNHGMSIDKVS